MFDNKGGHLERRPSRASYPDGVGKSPKTPGRPTASELSLDQTCAHMAKPVAQFGKWEDF